MANGTLSLPVGIDDNFQVNLLDESGGIVTSYSGSDTPTATVWGGSDTAVLFNPTCSWIDPTEGTIMMSILGTDTATLDPGKYRLRVGVTTQGGRKVAGDDYFLELTTSPGTAADLSVYCTHKDLLDYADWVDTLQSSSAREGFASHRHKARLWLERVILRHQAPNYYWNEPFTNLFGNSIGMGSASWNWGQTDPVLQDRLTNNYLRVTEQVVEITAKYALYLIANAQVGPDDKRTSWQNIAAEFYGDAQRLVKAFSAEIYLPGNSTSPIDTIHCGRLSTR